MNPIGAKGIGEIPIAGVAASIANAVYHATGKRVRDPADYPRQASLEQRGIAGEETVKA